MSQRETLSKKNHDELEEIHHEMDILERKSSIIIRLLSTILVIFLLLIMLVFMNGMFVHHETGLNEVNNSLGSDVVNI